MSAVWMRVRAELRARRRASVGLALLVAIAGGVVLAAAAGARRTDTAHARFLESARASDATVLAGAPGVGFNYSLDLDEVARFPEIAASSTSSAFFFSGTLEDGRPLPFGEHAIIAGPATPARAGLDLPRVVEGRLPDPAREDEIAVGFSYARDKGIEAGQGLGAALYHPSLLEDLTRAPEVPIVAKPRLRVVGLVAFPGSFPPGLSFGQLHATPAFYTRYANAVASVRSIAVRFREEQGAERSFNNRISRLTGGAADSIPQASISQSVERAIRLQAVALWLFAGLAGAAAALIVAQAFGRQIGIESGDALTLRALGMSRGHLFGSSMLRVAVVLAAGAAGAVAVAVAASPLFPIGVAATAEPGPGIRLDAGIVIGGAAALIAAVLLVSAAPAWIASGRRAEEPGPAGQSRPSFVVERLARARAPVTALAGVRLALERGRGPTATPVRSATRAAAIGIAALASALGFGASLVHLVETPRLYGVGWDMLAGNPFAPDLGDRLLPVLRSNENVGAFSAGAGLIQMEVRGPRGRTRALNGMALDLVQGRVHPTMIGGRWPTAPDEVALGTKILRSTGAAIGELVELTAGQNLGRFRVVGRVVIPSLNPDEGDTGGGVGLTIEGVHRVIPSAEINVFPLRFAAGADPDVARKNVAGEFGFAAAALGSVRPADIENLAQVRGAPVALAGLLGVVGAAALIHAVTSSVRRRRRDLAILKTVGFVRRQVSATVAWQATAMAAAALLMGLPLGVAAGRWIWSAYADRVGVLPEARVALAPIALAIPGTILLANLIAALPGRAAARTRPAAVLRTE